jgi:hypothetical protein
MGEAVSGRRKGQSEQVTSRVGLHGMSRAAAAFADSTNPREDEGDQQWSEGEVGHA